MMHHIHAIRGGLNSRSPTDNPASACRPHCGPEITGYAIICEVGPMGLAYRYCSVRRGRKTLILSHALECRESLRGRAERGVVDRLRGRRLAEIDQPFDLRLRRQY